MHTIKQYIIIMFLLIATSASGQVQTKLSPLVRQALMEQKAKSSARKATPDNAVLTAFVRTSDIESLREAGCKILAQWDDICIAYIPLNKLSEVAHMPQTKRIEAGERSTALNDTTASITNARKAWDYASPVSGVKGFTGKGVVVGVMDVGFDLTHPTLWSTDKTTYRVKALWDMLERQQTGSPVTGKDTTYVGRQYVTKTELLEKQHTYDGYFQTHGTHTTGTATGSGISSSLPMGESGGRGSHSGMAPDADICLVANATTNNADSILKEDIYKYNSVLDMLGFKYIFDFAKSQGMPCVINFSEGSYDDLYQSGIYSEVVKKLIGPGQILCASAGNNGLDATYLHKPAGKESAGALLARWSSNTGIYVARSTAPIKMNLYFGKSSTSTMQQWSYDATELAKYPDSLFVDTIHTDIGDYEIMLNTYPSCFNESDYATDILVKDIKGDHLGYSPRLVALQLLGRENDIEVITAGGYFLNSGNFSDAKESHNVCFPGSVEGVIGVGATSYVTSYPGYCTSTVGYNYGTDGQRASYSSIGPSIYGGNKPDVMAPGTNIVSSLNRYWAEAQSEEATSYVTDITTYEGREYPWGAMTGTSMSCPIVTGIVALWLQHCPTLSPSQVLDIIAHTSTQYDTSLEYPNIYYGYGQIDALEGLKYIEQAYTGIEELTLRHHPSRQRIYDLNGREVLTLEGHKGIFIVTDGITTKKVLAR